jgi:hypothetical protein
MPDTVSPAAFVPTARSRVRRHPERAHYDRETVFAILDAALMCHIGYVIDGLPYVTPTLFWREGERLYWHGSGLRHGQPYRWLGPRPLRLPPLAELPRGDGFRHRRYGR